MTNWLSKENILRGFEVCEEEIVELRDENKSMSKQLSIIDRLLNVIECHNPKRYGACDSEDILYNVRRTKNAIKEELKKEKV